MNRGTGRGAAADASTLAAGTLVSGVAAYLYVALGARVYGADGFAPVAIVWTAWQTAAATVGFPLEQYLSGVAAGDAVGRRALWRMAAAATALSSAAGGVAWVARHRLFADGDWRFALLVTGVSLASAGMGAVRGLLSGRGRYRAAASVTAGENLIRLLAGSLAALLGLSVLTYAAMLLTGALAAVPFRRGLGGNGTVHRASLRPLAGLSAGSACAHVALTAPPVVLAAAGAPPAEVTALFVALALFRIPYLLASGASARLAVHAADLVRGGDARRLRAAVLGLAAAAAGAAAIVALAAALLGSDVLRIVAGDDVSLPRPVLAAAAGGSVLGLATLAASVSALALQRTGALAPAWVGCAALATVVAAAATRDPLDTVAVGFACTMVLAAATITAVVAWDHPAPPRATRSR